MNAPQTAGGRTAGAIGIRPVRVPWSRTRFTTQRKCGRWGTRAARDMRVIGPPSKWRCGNPREPRRPM